LESLLLVTSLLPTILAAHTKSSSLRLNERLGLISPTEHSLSIHRPNCGRIMKVSCLLKLLAQQDSKGPSEAYWGRYVGFCHLSQLTEGFCRYLFLARVKAGQ
jgi:hypothetical protein